MEESNDIATPPPAPASTADGASSTTPAPLPAGEAIETAQDASDTGEGLHAETLQPGKEGQQDQQPGGLFDSPMIWVILGAVWLWALWSMRKNKKKQQAEQERQQELFRKGARIVTIGRLHGTIVSFDDKTVTIKPDEKRDLTLTFDRNAILHAVPDENTAASTNTAT